MNCLLVPTLALDGASLLERLSNTIDYPIKHKLVVNNGRPDALNEWMSKHPDWEVVHYGRNLGCSGSWNLFSVLFPEEQSCLIVNDDEQIQPGCLEVIAKAADEHAKDASILYVNEYESLGYFVWTKRGVEKFGLFDENLWPGYHEDLDMKARFKIAGADHYVIGPKDFPVKHGKPLPCSKAYHDTLNAIGAMNREYFVRKWGCFDDWHSWMPNSPAFKTPFNDPKQGLKDWTLDPKARAEREAIWWRFWNRPTTSLYG